MSVECWKKDGDIGCPLIGGINESFDKKNLCLREKWKVCSLEGQTAVIAVEDPKDPRDCLLRSKRDVTVSGGEAVLWQTA